MKEQTTKGSETLASSDTHNPPCRQKKSINLVWGKSVGFTLAEILIVLGIVGVVAGITVPALVSNVTTQAFSTASNVFLAKLREMTNQMSVNDELTGYTTNEGFADTFARYAKVSKRCNSTNLTSCFVPKFKGANDEAIDTANLTQSANLTKFNNTNTLVGFTLINGTNILMAYDPACSTVEADKYQLQKDKTYCMSMLYDINASAGPNKLGKDILLLNAVLQQSLGVLVDGLYVALTDTSPQSINTCTDNTWDSNLSVNPNCATNYWAGAKKSCSELGMYLPSLAELTKIYANKTIISNLITNGTNYWSSAGATPSNAWAQRLSDGVQTDNSKSNPNRVRCVRLP